MAGQVRSRQPRGTLARGAPTVRPVLLHALVLLLHVVLRAEATLLPHLPELLSAAGAELPLHHGQRAREQQTLEDLRGDTQDAPRSSRRSLAWWPFSDSPITATPSTTPVATTPHASAPAQAPAAAGASANGQSILNQYSPSTGQHISATAQPQAQPQPQPQAQPQPQPQAQPQTPASGWAGIPATAAVHLASPVGPTVQPLVSSHHCLGDSLSERSCVLRNVLYDVKSRTFQYGIDPQGPQRLVDFPKEGKPDHDFRGGKETFVLDSPYFTEHAHKHDGYRIKKLPVAEVAALGGEVAESWPKALLFTSFSHAGFEKLIMDDLFAVFAALLNLDRLQPDTTILVEKFSPQVKLLKMLLGTAPVSWDKKLKEYEEKGKRYVHFGEVVVGVVPYGTTNGLRWVASKQPPVTTKPPKPKSSDPVCGTGKNVNRASQWRRLRALAAANIGVDAGTLPRAHRVVIMAENSEHRIINAQEVAAHVSKQWRVADVRLVDPAKESFKNLAAIMAETTVSITRHGLPSVACIFQPRGSYMVMAASERGGLAEHEGFWGALEHVTSLVYPADHKEELTCAGAGHEERCAVTLDLRRLDALLAQAFYEMALPRAAPSSGLEGQVALAWPGAGAGEEGHPFAEGAAHVSSHRCLGDGFATRSCVLHNVLYEPATDTFLYGTERGAPPRIVDFYKGKKGVTVDEDFETQYGREARDHYVADLSFLNSPQNLGQIGYKIKKAKARQMEAQPEMRYDKAILIRQFGENNFGHYLIDNLYAVYAALDNLGMLDPAVEVMGNFDIAWAGQKYRHLDKWKSLFGKPGINLLDMTRKWGKGKYVSFGSVVVGIMPYGTTNAAWRVASRTGKAAMAVVKKARPCELGKAANRAAQWRRLRHVAMQNHGVDPAFLPRQHQITLVDKHGARKIKNLKQIAEHLAQRFQGTGVTVRTVNPADFSYGEQMDLMAKTTITLTPRGGVSFGSVFQAPGTYSIVPESMDPMWRATEHEFLWRELDYHNQLLYPASFGSLDCSMLKGKLERADGRVRYDDCDIKLELSVLDALIDQALYEMSIPQGPPASLPAHTA